MDSRNFSNCIIVVLIYTDVIFIWSDSNIHFHYFYANVIGGFYFLYAKPSGWIDRKVES
ncbi:hypothetical protein BTH160X_250003 [Brochothrix thermosphacta]|nr:hypothetical protein BTH160X_250003 [Brochothrix thermosphacta]